LQKHKKVIVGFLSTALARICNDISQLPVKQSHRQVLSVQSTL